MQSSLPVPNKQKNPPLHFAIAKPPKKKEVLALRIMVLGSFFWMAIFLWWFFHENRIGNAFLFWPLTFALILKLMHRAYEWYNYFDISVPHKPELKTKFTVDMLTTSCPGEPRHMIIRTLKKMVAVKYPHTTYLCDEGDDPLLKAACVKLGVVHVTRTEKVNAKAGNINNALKQATGDITIIMDPDHEPVPEFIDRVLPYFEDPKVGYVQCTQGYYNQPEGFVAKAAAEQTYHFYGPMMMCMNSYGTAQAIGANCAFRRAGLDSIGGHAPGLTEDMHTSMKMQALGWKPVFIPEMLSKGLVPADVSAFYKQQLKWGRGTFDLFAHVLPGLLKTMTWRQRIHHLMSPLYYLSGLVNFLNILIPIIALFIGDFPWKVNIEPFIVFYSPILLMTLFIRQYSQKWLLEKTERGFHIRGGLLQLGTWWVYLVSLIYTFFNVKVPYIPTPKEGVISNNWKLVMPNLIGAVLSAIAIVVGIIKDPTTYTYLMVGFATINVGFLGYFSIVVQQKLLLDIRNFWARLTHSHPHRDRRILFWQVRQGFYSSIRNLSFVLTVAMIVGFVSFELYEKETVLKAKSVDGFYKGVYFPNGDESIDLRAIKEWERKTNHRNDIVSFYQAWGPKSIEKFPLKTLDKLIVQRGATPLINWEPWSSTFQEFENDPELSNNKKILAGITAGKFDFYLDEYIQKIKALHGPVFIRFAHEFDNPFYPWSQSGDNSPEEFIKAHQYVVDYFALHGAENVAWVWNPWKSENMDNYYPGPAYVDWIGVTGLNYGFAGTDGEWYSFEEIYTPFQKKILKYDKPVMIAEFGSVAHGGNQQNWIDNAFTSIEVKFPEIKSVVFFNSAQDKNWVTEWRPEGSNDLIDWTFEDSDTYDDLDRHFSNPYYVKEKVISHLYEPHFKKIPNEKFFSREPSGQVHWMVRGKPYYVKGIAYNSGIDWRNGHIPLTTRTIREDFDDIKAMGANTIRRYGLCEFDKILLKVAKEKDLNIVFGFWLDQDVNYQTDKAKRDELEQEILEFVKKNKKDTSIIAWSLGNETWGLLKHVYRQPYLTVVRRSYIQFVEHLAEEIHAIDDTRPVLAVMEHTRELAGALTAYDQHAPALDMVGVNSYYIENIRSLDKVINKYYPHKPYMVSEFGPSGYWDKVLNHSKVDTLIEEAPDFTKAEYYAMQWNTFMSPDHTNLVGGFAYCWHDRIEGTATWYGITDFRGRKKPVYYALKEAWTGDTTKPDFPIINIKWGRDILRPGKYVDFYAQQLQKEPLPMNYEWSLQNEDGTTDYPGYIRKVKKGEHIIMKIPEVTGVYRLYLYAFDNNKNVTTISHPIVVTDENRYLGPGYYESN